MPTKEETEAPKQVLCIGFGNVVEKYWWDALEPHYRSGAIVLTIAETPEKARQFPGICRVLGDLALDGEIASGVFDCILILTPQHLHMQQLGHCLGLLCNRGKRCDILSDILIEKPVDASLPLARWMADSVAASAGRHRVRVVDHYVPKPAVARLSEHLKDTWGESNLPNAIKRVVYIACESAEMEDSLAFAEGWFIEHCPHFGAMLMGALDQGGDLLCKEWDLTDHCEGWRYTGIPAVCKRESAFCVTYKAGDLTMQLVGGKAVAPPGGDIKRLVFEGTDKAVVAYVNKAKVGRYKKEKKKEEKEKKEKKEKKEDCWEFHKWLDVSEMPTVAGKGHYAPIVEAIVQGSGLEHCTLSLEKGVEALSFVHKAHPHMAIGGDYPSGGPMPDPIADAIRLVPDGADASGCIRSDNDCC